jgi:membrane fusion protein (multidrug efflux system)
MVGLRSISVGSYVTPSDVIAGIRQLDPVRIEFSIPGRYAAQISEGMEIQFSLEGENEQLIGKVYAVESGIDQQTRMLVIRARASNPGNKIKPGAFVKVNMILERVDDAILVPTQSIVPILKGQQVFVSRDGKAEAVPVKIGIREESRVQITEGLKPGDTVVVTGVMSVRQGSALKWSNFR